MVQSVELLLDAAARDQVRGEWQQLVDAGLPSQARHTGSSNRPHISVGIARGLTASDEASIVRAVTGLPLSLRLGGALIFGSGSFVLARLVIPTVELLLFQERIIRSMGSAADSFAHQQPGHWSPHVTLARRLDSAQLKSALSTLSPMNDIPATAVVVRRWDGDRKIEWPIG